MTCPGVIHDSDKACLKPEKLWGCRQHRNVRSGSWQVCCPADDPEFPKIHVTGAHLLLRYDRLLRGRHGLVGREVRIVDDLALVLGQRGGGLGVPNLEVQVAEHHLDLKLQVQLQLVLGVDLSHQRQDALEPGVGRLEHLAVLAGLQHLHTKSCITVTKISSDLCICIAGGVLIACRAERPKVNREPAPASAREATEASWAYKVLILWQPEDAWTQEVERQCMLALLMKGSTAIILPCS